MICSEEKRVNNDKANAINEFEQMNWIQFVPVELINAQIKFSLK